MSFSQSLIQDAQPYLEANKQNAFIQDVINDQLTVDALNYYIQQDLRYADAETIVQTQLIAKSKTISDQRLFADQLSAHLRTVNDLFESLTKNVGRDWSTQRYQPIQPMTFLYREHILSQARDGSLIDVLAPFEAGIWMYIELGKYLKATNRIKPDNKFYTWVQDVQDPALAGPTGISNHFMKVIDREAKYLDDQRLTLVKENFLRSCLLEWYFWEAANKQLTWVDFERSAFKNDGSGLL
ncbi:TenA family protein [Lentilactobacillus raoultii]|uniref:Aminopyrimidine aminohydrolase n=1 Tax=Lentilactobacillus raoultii TaxID=1987503 RepID=A0ABW3PTD5_9LACO|nr:TenA family protein [Lentilactobacillus raoultii]